MKKFIWLINNIIFLLILLVGGFAFWLYPKQNISHDENRKLMPLPVFNSTTVFSGKFERDFEEYYNDHFPMRDKWLELASSINALKGIQEQEIRVLNIAATNTQDVTNEDPQELEQLESEDQILDESPEINSVHLPTMDNNQETVKMESDNNTAASKINHEENLEDETINKAKSAKINNDEFSKVKGVVIVNNRVLQVFAGTKHSITPYIKMMNTYRSKLPKDVKMYVMITPSGSDFYLPNKVNKGILKEKENIDYFESMLTEDIVSIPVYDELSNHRDEYIYFKTDHHWTGLGAYYAYTAFAKKAGVTPLTLEQMEFIQKNKTFLGSLYNYTKDKQLRNHPDTLQYYKVPQQSFVTVYTGNKTKFKGNLYVENNNSYLLFIGGDFPLIHINTPANNQRKILIIKDSFGNALVPYLAYHYSDIYVVDYRYFKNSILDLINKHEIKELLYIHNTFAANSNAAVKFGFGLLNGRNKDVKKK